MKLTLRIWRQADSASKGSLRTYRLDDVSPDMSFLEMLDALNEQLNADGEEPVAFDSDCREGICGMCGLMINGEAHGPSRTTTCQLHMRSFTDGDTITIEPWRATAFPVLKDLCVDRRAFDRLIQAGGYISVNTGAAPDAHAMPVPKGQRRPGLRRGHLHRLRRLRRRLPQRLGLAVPRREDHPPRANCRRGRPSATPGWCRWPPSTTPRASAAAPTSASAPPPAPRRSRIDVISQLNWDLHAAMRHGR